MCRLTCQNVVKHFFQKFCNCTPKLDFESNPPPPVCAGTSMCTNFFIDSVQSPLIPSAKPTRALEPMRFSCLLYEWPHLFLVVLCISVLPLSMLTGNLSTAAPNWLKLLWISTVCFCQCNITINWYVSWFSFDKADEWLLWEEARNVTLNCNRFFYSNTLVSLNVSDDACFPQSLARFTTLWYTLL